MNAITLYIKVSRTVFQSINVTEGAKWNDINQLFIFLRQSLTCCVCSNLLSIPMTSSVSSCQHHICKDCIGGKIKLKPSCLYCKDQSKFVEDTQLRILLQSYRGLCQYINSTDIPNKWGSLPVLFSSNLNGPSSTLTSSHGLGNCLAGPSNFYQLIEEGANLKDKYNFVSTTNSSTTNLNSKDNSKENIDANNSIKKLTSSPPATTKSAASKLPSTSNLKTAPATPGKNKINTSLNSSKIDGKPGSSNVTQGKAKAIANKNKEKTKVTVSPKSMQNNSGQAKKVKQGNSNQTKEQLKTNSTTKPSVTVTKTLPSSDTKSDVAQKIASLTNGKTNTVTVVSPKTHIISDPSSKISKFLRLPAALSISAIKTTKNSNGQPTTPSFVFAKKAGDKVVTKSADHGISLSVLSSGQLAISSSSAVKNGASITISNGAMKMLKNSTSSLPVTQKAVTSLPVGFKCVAINSSVNKVTSTPEQTKVLLTPTKIQQNIPITQQSSQLVTTNSSLKAKTGRLGCRCGLATANPGKLTCCGQRCPCYVDGKGCYDCKCRGCRNPRRANPRSTSPSKEINGKITSLDKSSNPTNSSSQIVNGFSQSNVTFSSLNSSFTSSPSRSTNLFLSSELNLDSPMTTISNGLTLISSNNSNVSANDLLTLPLMEEDSLTTTTNVDEEKLPYSMVICET